MPYSLSHHEGSQKCLKLPNMNNMTAKFIFLFPLNSSVPVSWTSAVPCLSLLPFFCFFHSELNVNLQGWYLATALKRHKRLLTHINNHCFPTKNHLEGHTCVCPMVGIYGPLRFMSRHHWCLLRWKKKKLAFSESWKREQAIWPACSEQQHSVQIGNVFFTVF